MNVTLELHEDRADVVVKRSNGAVSSKVVSLESIVEAFVQNQQHQIRLDFLPPGFRAYARKSREDLVALEVPEGTYSIRYLHDDYDEEYDDEPPVYEVPLPRALFFIRITRVPEGYVHRETRIFALKHPLTLPTDTVYTYPLPNHSSDVCWGAQELPTLRNLAAVQSYPSLFFNSDFNADLEYDKFEPYDKGSQRIAFMRDLLQDLNGSDEFPLDCLYSRGTFQDRWNAFIS